MRCSGEDHPRWKGGENTHSLGYIRILNPENIRSIDGYMYKHIVVMEKSLGRPILKSESVHHIDGDKTNNNIGNLILFKTYAMHRQFHHRLKAFEHSGHWDWRKCYYCHTYDSPDNLYIYNRGARHRECAYEANKKYKGR
jgi:uncharacterized protein (DUF1330 family)